MSAAGVRSLWVLLALTIVCIAVPVKARAERPHLDGDVGTDRLEAIAPTTTPATTGPPPGLDELGRPEQQGSLGASTFASTSPLQDQNLPVAPYEWVAVACKKYDTSIGSVSPDGYWYLIASPPWNNERWVAANTFWNGDTPGVTPYLHNTDLSVPDCTHDQLSGTGS